MTHELAARLQAQLAEATRRAVARAHHTLRLIAVAAGRERDPAKRAELHRIATAIRRTLAELTGQPDSFHLSEAPWMPEAPPLPVMRDAALQPILRGAP